MNQFSLQNLNQTLNKYYLNQDIYCHPENYDFLLKNLYEGTGHHTYLSNFSSYKKFDYEFLYGIKIYQDRHLPKCIRRWEFPADKFVEYEKSDEVWAIPLGFGSYVDTSERAFFVIDRTKIYYTAKDWIFTQPFKYLLTCFS